MHLSYSLMSLVIIPGPCAAFTKASSYSFLFLSITPPAPITLPTMYTDPLCRPKASPPQPKAARRGQQWRQGLMSLSGHLSWSQREQTGKQRLGCNSSV